MPGNRNTAKVGEAFTLDAHFSLSGEAADVYEVARVEIHDVDANVLATITTIARVYDDDDDLIVGAYRVTVPALTQGGDLYDVWTYTPVEDAEERTLQLEVTVDKVTGEEGEEAPAPSAPTSGLSSVCEVTATFLDAGGNAVRGVYVRFSRKPGSAQPTAYGFVAREITAQSDDDGELSMYLLRGMTGTLTVTGIGLVREVTVPDADTVDLFDLVSDTQDLLAVQDLEFVTLPRSS